MNKWTINVDSYVDIRVVNSACVLAGWQDQLKVVSKSFKAIPKTASKCWAP